MARKSAVVFVVFVTSAAAQVGQKPAPSYGNALTTMDALSKQNPPVQLEKFAESETCTINFLSAKGEVRAHYHAKHEESVVVLRGSGVFKMASGVHSIKAGDVMHIPRGIVHSFVPSSDDVVVVSIFSPKFDGVDRVFVGG